MDSDVARRDCAPCSLFELFHIDVDNLVDNSVDKWVEKWGRSAMSHSGETMDADVDRKIVHHYRRKILADSRLLIIFADEKHKNTQ